MVIGEAVKYGINTLDGVHNSALDAHLFLCEAMGISRLELLTQGDRALDEEQRIKYEKMLMRRLAGEPAQYILGRCEFMSLEFLVNENVLIPRPDTEILVETVLENISAGRMLDIGTGSGCIAISIAYYNKAVTFDALDVSKKALEVAKENARLLGMADRIEFVNHDVFNGWQGQYDAVVSNPPYIESDVVPTLQIEVQNEPKLALVGGTDGLDYYRHIIAIAPQLLKPNGLLAFEVGHTQSGAVSQLMKENGLINIQTTKDLAGIERVVFGRNGSGTL